MMFLPPDNDLQIESNEEIAPDNDLQIESEIQENVRTFLEGLIDDEEAKDDKVLLLKEWCDEHHPKVDVYRLRTPESIINRVVESVGD